MEQQLALIDRTEPRHRSWKLDDQTRQAGRRGIEASRRALREAARRQAGRARSDRHAA